MNTRPFPYTPHRMDGVKLTPWFDCSGTGEYSSDVPLSIRNAVADRNTHRIAFCTRLQFELSVESFYPDAVIYGDRFGAVALDGKTRNPVGSYTRDARHACIRYPAHLSI